MMIRESELASRSPFKFGLKELFYASALIASGLALSLNTIWFSLFALLVWAVIFSRRDPRKVVFGFCKSIGKNLLEVLVGILVLIILLFLFLPSVPIRRTPQRASCLNNLRQIVMALHNFESVNGYFPTDRIVTTPDGTQLRHSWRISLLPYMEELSVYELYDFNEPWNGPNNSKLAGKMSQIWRCPFSRSTKLTNYRLVNGPGTAFELGKRVNTTTVSDGLSTTIALIEDSANPVNWMEPDDLTAEEAARILNSNYKGHGPHVVETLFERRYFGPNIAMLDGSVQNLPLTTNPPVTTGAFLISDGVLFDSQIATGFQVEIKYHAYGALVLYVLLILLPAVILLNSSSTRIRAS
jgi:hypothetical protein